MKDKKDMIAHISIIGVILIILIVSIVKLAIWNMGKDSNDNANPDTIGENFDTEAEDYITVMSDDLLANKVEDGNNTVVFLGDNTLADYQGADGIATQVKNSLDSSVIYDCSFSNSTTAATESTWSGAQPTDAFSLYWIAKSIALNDYTLLDNAVKEVPDSSTYEEKITTLKSIDFMKVDTLVIMCSVNDYLKGNLITSTTDLNDISAYSGSLSASIQAIKEAYPHIYIVVASPTYCITQGNDIAKNGSDIANTGYGTLPDYMVACKTIAVDSNVTYLDNYYGVDINSQTYKDYLESDNIHPNAAGRKLIADRLTKVLAPSTQTQETK